jgi:hypothetical protein
MKKIVSKFVLVIGSFVITNVALAQMPDTVATICEKHLEKSFISDGQQYRSLLMNNEETAEFHTVLYGGTTYRVAACTGLSDGHLVFSVYDKDRHLLFSNIDFNNTPYWDFKVNNTLDCIIEAKLDESKKSGRAVILIGFKQPK